MATVGLAFVIVELLVSVTVSPHLMSYSTMMFVTVVMKRAILEQNEYGRNVSFESSPEHMMTRETPELVADRADASRRRSEPDAAHEMLVHF